MPRRSVAMGQIPSIGSYTTPGFDISMPKRTGMHCQTDLPGLSNCDANQERLP